MNLSNLTGLLFESEGYSRKSRKKIQKNGDRLYYLKAAGREMTTASGLSARKQRKLRHTQGLPLSLKIIFCTLQFFEGSSRIRR
jgi:hypothetical protein